jgi:hypothetical protein
MAGNRGKLPTGESARTSFSHSKIMPRFRLNIHEHLVILPPPPLALSFPLPPRSNTLNTQLESIPEAKEIYFCNYPLPNSSFCRSEFNAINSREISITLPGVYVYYSSNSPNLKSVFIISPRLFVPRYFQFLPLRSISDSSPTELPLDAIAILTVIPKWLPAIPQWLPYFQAIASTVRKLFR